MWRVLFLACSACSFSTNVPAAGDDQAAPVDAPDAAVDALEACDVVPSGTPIVAGMLGPGGGSTRPDVVCGAGEVPIGFDFEWEINAEIIGVHVRCASLARDASGTITMTPSGRAGDNGRHGTCIIGSTQDAEQQTCPPGQVLVGIQANNVGTSYNSFTMRCQPIGADLVVAGATMAIAFPKTGSLADDVESVTCPAGTTVLSFGLKSGCDQEQLVVRCTALACN